MISVISQDNSVMDPVFRGHGELLLSPEGHFNFSWDVRTLTCLPTKGFSIKPLKVKLLAGEQKATETL